MQKLKIILFFLALLNYQFIKGQTCTANFAYTLTAPGQVNLISTSVGTNANTIYTWNFPGAITTSISGAFLTQPIMTYSTNANYQVILNIFNPITSCSSTFSQNVTVNNVSVAPTCYLHANFSYTPMANGQVSFRNASTGSFSSTSLNWKFHDNSTQSGTVASKSYTASSVYSVTLVATNTNPLCIDSIVRTVSVSVSPCTVNVNYTPYTSSTSCNGFASIGSLTNLCGGATTYTWSNSSSTSTIGGLCPGNYYVLVGGNTQGSNCCPVLSGSFVIQSCPGPPVISYTQSANGHVGFLSTATGSTTTYFWNYGDGQSGFGQTPAHTYSANGTYIATLTAGTNSFCVSTVTIAVNVDSYCNLSVGFNYIPGTNGNISFNSTSTGTVPGSLYTWDFGDSTIIGPCSCPNIANTYTANGMYTVTLQVTNNFTTVNCSTLTSQTFSVGNVCTLNAVLNYTTAPNWLVNFAATYTGIPQPTNFVWDFGDGSSGSGVTTSHTYSSNGTYQVLLYASGNQTPYVCGDSVITSVIVNSNCNMTSSFNHTVGTSGLVQYKSSSTGTNSSTLYNWNFGDGTSGTGNNNVSHNYSNGGAHLVSLIISDPVHTTCRDTIIQSVNITGISCTANSNFTVTPTNVAQYWNATPSYPWNVMAATWNWGDGTSSNQLYTSHQYSVSATYSICLTVTVSCGASNSTCSSYYVFRSQEPGSMSMININVVPPNLIPVGLDKAEDKTPVFEIFPNPNNGSFSIFVNNIGETELRLELIDMTGRLINSDLIPVINNEIFKSFEVPELANGIYFLRIPGKPAKKMIINK